MRAAARGQVWEERLTQRKGSDAPVPAVVRRVWSGPAPRLSPSSGGSDSVPAGALWVPAVPRAVFLGLSAGRSDPASLLLGAPVLAAQANAGPYGDKALVGDPPSSLSPSSSPRSRTGPKSAPHFLQGFSQLTPGKPPLITCVCVPFAAITMRHRRRS